MTHFHQLRGMYIYAADVFVDSLFVPSKVDFINCS